MLPVGLDLIRPKKKNNKLVSLIQGCSNGAKRKIDESGITLVFFTKLLKVPARVLVSFRHFHLRLDMKTQNNLERLGRTCVCKLAFLKME